MRDALPQSGLTNHPPARKLRWPVRLGLRFVIVYIRGFPTSAFSLVLVVVLVLDSRSGLIWSDLACRAEVLT
jgi:hypothetical protein